MTPFAHAPSIVIEHIPRVTGMDRDIVCLRIPSFEIALARLEDSSLRGRPVAVAASLHPRAVIREVSAEAAGDGVSAGMAVDHARWLCPTLSLLPPSTSRIRRGQHAVEDVIGEYAPVWEPAGPGHLFLDLSGTRCLFGRTVDAASRIGREVSRRAGLSAAVGTGSNKLVTDVAATLVRPAELYDVPAGGERGFMAPLPTAALPELAVPRARPLLVLLTDLNLLTLGAVAAVAPAVLEFAAGSAAPHLHRRAQGIDESPVIPVHAHPRLNESAVLDVDSVDLPTVRAYVFTLAERIGRTLRSDRRTCGRITLTLVHADFVEASARAQIRPPTALDAVLTAAAADLLVRAMKRRVRIRRIVLDADVADGEHEQLMLFPSHRPDAEPFREPDPERIRRLTDTIDRIRARHGDTAVQWGYLEPLAEPALNPTVGRGSGLGFRGRIRH